ncbi:hypothetical protein LOY42_13720 [Pseudomonas sp. B21-023]|uniref:hypothetical protein n=1 Tax=unclassified Pseudomonas TaxID=196821 RepID=UPI0015572834|nr:hypothetical protein [Pseudomonas sp. B21-023]NQD76852.1 hypothetical protein [Pseudomonas sp. CM27]UVM14364.1 hypothetical protein LOY42_13720 [Pseudomonas sp. B21-023]
MRTLSDIAATLFMALAARHVEGQVSLADAAALIAGRTHKWSTWNHLALEQQITIARALRLRPPELAQPARFIEIAEGVLAHEHSPFELVDLDSPGTALSEKDQYQVRTVLNVDQVIQEYLDALKGWHQPPSTAKIPESGSVAFKYITAERTRTFTIPAEERSCLPKGAEYLTIPDVDCLPEVEWDYTTLRSIAKRLDAAATPHTQHCASLDNIWGNAGKRSADAGSFFRVNAATGTGKTVVMSLMGVDAASRGHKVVIAVPGYVELENTVRIMREAASVVAPGLKIAPLHSASKIPTRAALHFKNRSEDHPYDYACLLNAFSTDQEEMPAGSEPCFKLQVVTSKPNSQETTKRISHCPFLFTCGQTKMMARALEADIIVINHHALLSGTSRIPFEDSDKLPGPRSLIEILLRTAPIFLVDEIDGLLKTAIDNSALSLQLGNIGEDSPLMQLFRTLVSNRSRIPGIDNSSILRIIWALTYCCVSVDQLMNLQQRRYFEWPKKETTWAQADDGYIKAKLDISAETLEALYRSGNASVPKHLMALRENLVYWRTNDPASRPESMAAELGSLLVALSDGHHLKEKLNPKDHQRLKASLILRGVLDYIEIALRNLQIELPSFANAEVPYAQEVHSKLKGREPLSFSPIGPLHRTVFGFKRKQTSEEQSTLNVVAMRGDPHGTLLALPELAALGFAGVRRMFMGFSATAYFPGASAFDLKARDFIDVPDAKGQVTFENIGLTTVVSGAPYFERKERIRQLALELWPWLERRLHSLAKDPATQDRARLLLVASSDADAELLAITLADLCPTPTVGWVRGRSSEYKPTLLNSEHALVYDDLAQFIDGIHRNKTILVSALQPMARGHNIVNKDGLSAIGGVVLCVRPLPASDSPENNLAHISYETWNRMQPQPSLRHILHTERVISNKLLDSIRGAPPAFSQQPPNIRHYTVMNILVTLTQLIGRGRRGGTPVTCFFADAAFTRGRTPWAKLLSDSVKWLKEEGNWNQFSLHHNGIATAITKYIDQSAKEVR